MVAKVVISLSEMQQDCRLKRNHAILTPDNSKLHRGKGQRLFHPWLSDWLLQMLFPSLVWLVLLSSSASAISLPMDMPRSHPKHYLTLGGQDLTSSTSGAQAVSSNRVPVDVESDMVNEDAVMYHFYKNGRLGASYRRKASTVFMVRLFNDMLRGLTPLRSLRNSVDQKATEDPEDKDNLPLTNTIRSFSAAEVKYSKKKKATVIFTVPLLPPNERLRSAEIRFLRQPSSQKKKMSSKLKIDVMRGNQRVERVVLQESAVIQQDYDVFDVSRVLETWINSYHGNISLKVRIPRKLEKTIMLSDSSLKSTSLIALYLEDKEFLRNMYESYTTDDLRSSEVSGSSQSRQQVDPRTSARAKRDSSARGTKGSKRRRYRNRKNKRWYRASKHEKCQMYDFEVDFDFIGWGQWIIHPKKFNSRFCYGECPSPVDTKYKPTNHAMLQTLMRQKKPRLAPPTCCVPIKLKPLSMLYFEYDEIVVRHHENMIADECGCR